MLAGLDKLTQEMLPFGEVNVERFMVLVTCSGEQHQRGLLALPRRGAGLQVPVVVGPTGRWRLASVAATMRGAARASRFPPSVLRRKVARWAHRVQQRHWFGEGGASCESLY